VIALVRHGKPDYTNKNKLTVEQMVQELAHYNKTSILIKDQNEQIQLISDKIKDADVIFCSGLTRAKETARIFFKPEQIIFDNELNEFGLHPQMFMTKRASFSTYLIYSRILLMLGKKCSSCESHRDAICRVARFHQRMRKNYPGKNIVIFGHSLFFRYIQRLLKKDGLRCSFSTGHSCLGIKIFTRR